MEEMQWGGVINIITKRPENKVSGFTEVSLGNYSQQRVTAGIKMPLKKTDYFLVRRAYLKKQMAFTKTYLIILAMINNILLQAIITLSTQVKISGTSLSI